MGHGTTRLPNNNLTAAGSQGKNSRGMESLAQRRKGAERGKVLLNPGD
jgi:hypothetical protein